MLNARDLRLRADYESLKRLIEQSQGALVLESASGRPPDEYILAFHCRSVARLEGGKPVYSALHRVRVRLPARYPLPSAPPRLDLLTPLFNPHVYVNRQICLGSWQTSEFLDELVIRVAALIQFDRRILNMRDPANPDAMEWVTRNLLLLPTDDKLLGQQDAAVSAINPDMLVEGASEQDPESDLEWVDA